MLQLYRTGRYASSLTSQEQPRMNLHKYVVLSQMVPVPHQNSLVSNFSCATTGTYVERALVEL